jgi:hypothetical protein
MKSNLLFNLSASYLRLPTQSRKRHACVSRAYEYGTVSGGFPQEKPWPASDEGRLCGSVWHGGGCHCPAGLINRLYNLAHYETIVPLKRWPRIAV